MTPTVPSPWKVGDFHVIGRTHTTDALCEDCDISAGARVVDVACGSGNTALAAARFGATVSGIDVAEHLIERARKRADAETFDIDFRVGDAQHLPYDDETFDYVLSTFGVIFAPDQRRAADELLRVCKPNGIIGLSVWPPESLPGMQWALAARYGPPPPGPHSPIEWGTMKGLRRLFGGRVRRMRVIDRSFRARARNVDEWFDMMRTYLGPAKILFDNLPHEHIAVARDEFKELAERFNRATDGTLAVHMGYVNVVIER